VNFKEKKTKTTETAQMGVVQIKKPCLGSISWFC